MRVTITPLDLPGDRAAVGAFLAAHEWPFHLRPVVAPADVDSMDLDGEGTASFWIERDRERVGLLRLTDLEDIDDVGGGAPLFDLRLASTARGAGIGTEAVRWLERHLFGLHPSLHRIEANTREDNVAMQTVLERCGFRHEGRLRETWPAADGSRLDTFVYGLLRSEWVAVPAPD